MGIGAGILLAAVGAILYFAVDADINGLDLRVVGVILMIAGAISVLVDLVIFAPRRRRSSTVIEEPGVRTTRDTNTY